jgi:two-component system, OmpR family, response regulator
MVIVDALESAGRRLRQMTSTDAPIKVLFVEDDERLARLTTRYLESSGFLVTWVATGPGGAAEALRRQYDIILLDLMLPGRDGMDVCRDLRTRTGVPIIMVTARKDEVDRVLGLDSGADDYMTKPFSSRELESRIRAAVRRARGLVGPALRPLRVGPISLDPRSARVTVSGREVALTGYEFALLRVLAERAGYVLSREQLLDLAKGSAEDAYDRSIDVQMSRLRQKIGEDARQPRYLRTIRGMGYVLVSGADD